MLFITTLTHKSPTKQIYHLPDQLLYRLLQPLGVGKGGPHNYVRVTNTSLCSLSILMSMSLYSYQPDEIYAEPFFFKILTTNFVAWFQGPSQGLIDTTVLIIFFDEYISHCGYRPT